MQQPSVNEKPKTTLQTVERALNVLEYVAQRDTAPTIRDVADALKLNVTTTYHLFNTLNARGYLQRDAYGRLRIGAKVAMLYEGQLRNFDASRDLRPVLEKMAAATNETVYLACRTDAGVIIQALIEPSQGLRVSGLYVGYHGKEHLRASGKAVLAHLPEPAWQSIVVPQLSNSSPRELQQHLATLEAEFIEVRKRGYAIDDEDYEAGICCISAPFFNHDGQPAGSMTVSGPASRFHAEHSRIVEAVVNAADSASMAHGFEPRTHLVRADE